MRKLLAIAVIAAAFVAGGAAWALTHRAPDTRKVCADAAAVFDQWEGRPETAGDAREAEDVATLRIEAVNAGARVQAALGDLRNAVVQADPTGLAKQEGVVLGVCRP